MEDKHTHKYTHTHTHTRIDTQTYTHTHAHFIIKDASQVRNITDWIDEWRDDSPWKKRFMHLFPKSVYVEVENYFVKALIGWTGVQE